jgi:alkylation response protein AidB-like acyl-CoA dehydrogenase
MQRAAGLATPDSTPGKPATSPNWAAAEAVVFCLDWVIQTHGGNGVSREYQLANYWFLARLQLIAPVSREMILNYVSEHVLGLPRSY